MSAVEIIARVIIAAPAVVLAGYGCIYIWRNWRGTGTKLGVSIGIGIGVWLLAVAVVNAP